MSDIKRGGAQLAEAVKRAYELGQDDYHLEPMLLVEDGKPVGKIADGDSVVFCCRRGEREIELTEMFTDDPFDKVERRKLNDLDFVIMTMYHDKFKNLPIAFAPAKVVKPLAQVLSEAGKKQFHCAESEKFAHVTFFFNGGENNAFPGEDDVCIPSPKGIDFDQKPELSLPKVADTVMDALGKYDFVVTNFANGDVIGHTQNTAAKIQACAHVSHYLDEVVHDALVKGYVVAVTADHGNIEKLYGPSPPRWPASPCPRARTGSRTSKFCSSSATAGALAPATRTTPSMWPTPPTGIPCLPSSPGASSTPPASSWAWAPAKPATPRPATLTWAPAAA